MGEELWQKSAVEVASGIRERQFTCSDVMESVVGRIRALNPKLNAIVMDLTDQALAEAAAADSAFKHDDRAPPLAPVRHREHPRAAHGLALGRQGRVKRRGLFVVNQLREIDAELRRTNPHARRAEGHREGRKEG